VLEGLHHGVGLGDAEVDTGCVYGTLALGGGFVFTRQLEVLLEIGYRLLDQVFLVVKET